MKGTRLARSILLYHSWRICSGIQKLSESACDFVLRLFDVRRGWRCMSQAYTFSAEIMSPRLFVVQLCYSRTSLTLWNGHIKFSTRLCTLSITMRVWPVFISRVGPASFLSFSSLPNPIKRSETQASRSASTNSSIWTTIPGLLPSTEDQSLYSIQLRPCSGTQPPSGTVTVGATDMRHDAGWGTHE